MLRRSPTGGPPGTAKFLEHLDLHRLEIELRQQIILGGKIASVERREDLDACVMQRCRLADELAEQHRWQQSEWHVLSHIARVERGRDIRLPAPNHRT